MRNNFIITGTDTNIGKTAFAAMLMLGLEGHGGAHYWKPVQSGVSEGVDTRIVQNLTGLPADRFLPEAYILSEPLSPHRAAEIDGVEINIEKLNPPASDRTLLIEGAGGLMVPMTRKNLQINLFKRWNAPVILCARTKLGTINHTLLSLEALWSRDMAVHGIVFIGDDMPDTMETIGAISGVKILGRMPWINDLNAENLKRAFDMNFDAQNFVIPSEA
jgi:dethiobiotin synthetase